LRETAPALSNLATAYTFQQQFAQAIPLLERAVQLSPMSDRLWRNLGDAYAMTNADPAKITTAYRKALEVAQSQLKINPNSAATLSRAALYSAKLKDFAEARRMIARARTANPKDNDVIFKAALIAELSGNRAEAVDAIDSAWKNGYSLEQIRKEPELTALREDVRFQSWLTRVSK
jgi:eukaryotic-like serine/threonine-protein kinase